MGDRWGTAGVYDGVVVEKTFKSRVKMYLRFYIVYVKEFKFSLSHLFIYLFQY